MAEAAKAATPIDDIDGHIAALSASNAAQVSK